MYSEELDCPPPRSHFRHRPWSPAGFQSGPEGVIWQNLHMNALSDQGHNGSLQGMSSNTRQQRREASDISVEALDLADYSKTLRTRQADDPYPPFPSSIAQPQPHYPPSAYPNIPRLATSRDSIALQVPSLISRGPTSSSLGTHFTTLSSAPSHARRVTRKHYSMPPTPNNSSQPSGSSRNHPHTHHPHQRQDPYIVDPDAYHPDEIDTSRFPKWSRGWYESNNSHTTPHFDDVYTPIPHSIFGSSKNKTAFDLRYSSRGSNDAPPPFMSAGTESHRNLLPWSMDPPEYGPPLHPVLKEERIRMLEREFGVKDRKGKGKDSGIFDDEGQPKVGFADEKGNLITSGPKRRIIVRLLEIVLAAAACIPVVYASLAIKSPDPKDPPPPANKPPIFVLYFLSSLTLILLLYLFLIRPCFVRKPDSEQDSLLNKGMMVFPVLGSGKEESKASKKGKKKRQGPGNQVPGDVQVNLIVDPQAFQPISDVSEDEDGSSDGDIQTMPGGYERARRKKKQRNRRRGILEGMRMEERWKFARSWAKKITAVDVAGLVLWSATFVFIILGKRCPSGGYNGWCNAYNVSTASACLLAVAFGVSLFYDVQDLFASKQSPRTRV